MFRPLLSLLLLCVMTATSASALAARVEVNTGHATLDAVFTTLLGRDFDAKLAAIEQLGVSGHPRAAALLRGILEGDLRINKDDGRLTFFIERDAGYLARDALTDTELGQLNKRKLGKFAINNTIRGTIRGLLATMELSDPDPQVRLVAIQAMLTSPQPEHEQILTARLAAEPDNQIQELMRTGIALARLTASDPGQRLQAVAGVADSLEPAVRNALAKLADSDADNGVRKAAAKALKTIDARIARFGQLETLFFGLSLGSVLVLAAIGLAITFGVMGVINMAHGELIMLGAYTTYLLQQVLPDYPGVSLMLSIPAAFIVSGLVGIAIERGVIRFLYGRPLETLLATFGISLVLQQAARTLISPQNVPVANPEWMSGFWQVNSVLSLTYNRLYILLFCMLVFIGLFLILKRTRLGLQVRAVAQNRAMARAMGVRSARVDALTFGLGSGIAGIAGVALSQLTNVGPNLGQAYIVDSFMVVVFGGVGNLWGTLIGGLSLGIANKLLEPWSGAVLAKILVLVFIILFIQKRPRGLFPQKGRAVES